MSLVTFLRHSIRSVTRNRRRTFSSILGIILAITMVAGVNIALDSTTGNILRGLLDQVPYDFVASGNRPDWRNVTLALEGVSNVRDVEPVITVSWTDIVAWDGTGNYTFMGAGIVYGVRPTFARHMEDFSLQGPVPTENGTVVLNPDLFMYPGATPPIVGDTMTLRISSYSPSGNVTEFFFNMTVAGFVGSKETSVGFGFGYSEFYSSIFVTVPDALMMRDAVTDSFRYDEDRFYVWADRDALVEPFSSEATKTNMIRMQRILQRAVDPYGVTVSSGGLGYAIDSFNIMVLTLRLLFVALSLPALVLAIYLGSVGVEMGMEERRREITIIKARGADSGHITGMLVLEAIVSGTVAGLLGLVFGLLASRFLLGSMIGMTGAPVDLAIFNISIATVVITIVLAIIFMGVASFRPIRQASKMPVAEGLHRHLESETKLVYKPTWDIIFLVLAGLTIGLVFYMSSQSGGDPFAYASLLCILGPFLAVLIPLSPVFLTLGLTRLLTRGTTKVYGWAARAVKPFAKELYQLVRLNLLRNPRRASRICLLVAFGLSFGVLVSTMAESQLAYDERLVQMQVGADIRVESYDANITFQQNLSSVPGVKTVVPVFTLFGDTSESINVFNASRYLQAVNVDSYFFTKGAPDALELLTDEGYAIVSQDFARREYYDIGDILAVTVRTFDGTFMNSTTYNLDIVAVVKALPGLQGRETFDFGGFYGGNIYVDFSSLPAADFERMNILNMISGARFLVDVSGDNATEVAEAIEDTYPSLRTTVLQEEILKARSDPMKGATFHFLVIEIAFVVLIMSFGIGLVMYTATLEREVELGNIRARGASGVQLGQLLLGEAMAIVLIGVLIGLGTGTIVAVAFNGVLNFPAAFGGSTAALDRPFVFGLQSFTLVIVTIISLIVAALIATYRVRSMDLSRVLRKRGG